MTSTVPKTIPDAPPDDPVATALADPELRAKMIRSAQVRLKNFADAEQVVDEAIFRLLQKKSQYNPEVAKVSTWLAQFVANTIREKFRDRAKHSGAPLVEHCSAKINHEPDLADIRFQVEQFMSKLSGEYRAAVKMRFFEDLEYVEIARRLETTQLNARQKVSRGLAQLREYAMKEGHR